MSKSTLRPTLPDKELRWQGLTPKIDPRVSGVLGFVFGAITLLLVAATPMSHAMLDAASTSSPPSSLTLDRATVADPLDFESGFVGVAEATVPGVVRIETRRTEQASELASPTMPPGMVPPGFRFFFEDPRFGGGMSPDQPRRALSGGTGFVVSEDGYILTNHHVVDDADDITVWLHDRRSFTGHLVGSDPTTDVAVLKIEGEDLPALPLGSSDDVRVGEWILAVGNPGFRGGRPLEETVTVGIVSAVGRPLSVIRSGLSQDPNDRAMAEWAIEDFIQTDAVINPGNSGGPLVNMAGEVVGVNTAIMSTTGYYQGYGFAIPIDLVMGVFNDLVEHGHVRRAWLGVRISDVTAEDAEAFGLPDIRGVLIQGVTDEGPGEEAGLEMGDVIVEVDGHAVDRVGALQQRIARTEPGTRVTLEVMRDGKPKTIRVRLGEAPFEGQARVVSNDRSRTGADLLGLEFSEITPALQQRFGWERDSGVVVTGVDSWGPAARKNVVPGTRVLSVNGESIDDLEELQEELEKIQEGDVVSLVLEGAGGTSWIANIRAQTP